jgi:hypothetical protein
VSRPESEPTGEPVRGNEVALLSSAERFVQGQRLLPPASPTALTPRHTGTFGEQIAVPGVFGGQSAVEAMIVDEVFKVGEEGLEQAPGWVKNAAR